MKAAILFALALAASTADAMGPGVESFCGGVGSDERRALEAHRAGTNLELQFVTARRGGYVAGVKVTLWRGKDNLGTIEADGPMCLVNVPEGSYRLEAVHGGATTTRVVRVAKGRQKVTFTFPEEPSEGIEASPEEKRQAREP